MNDIYMIILTSITTTMILGSFRYCFERHVTKRVTNRDTKLTDLSVYQIVYNFAVDYLKLENKLKYNMRSAPKISKNKQGKYHVSSSIRPTNKTRYELEVENDKLLREKEAKNKKINKIK